jgi:hypothetical protein
VNLRYTIYDIRGDPQRTAGLETRETADLEVCGTSRRTKLDFEVGREWYIVISNTESWNQTKILR